MPDSLRLPTTFFAFRGMFDVVPSTDLLTSIARSVPEELFNQKVDFWREEAERLKADGYRLYCDQSLRLKTAISLADNTYHVSPLYFFFGPNQLQVVDQGRFDWLTDERIDTMKLANYYYDTDIGLFRSDPADTLVAIVDLVLRMLRDEFEIENWGTWSTQYINNNIGDVLKIVTSVLPGLSVILEQDPGLIVDLPEKVRLLRYEELVSTPSLFLLILTQFCKPAVNVEKAREYLEEAGLGYILELYGDSVDDTIREWIEENLKAGGHLSLT